MISVFCGTSLDGFIARKDDTYDFLFINGAQPHGFQEFLATIDALVIGRNTYDVVAKHSEWPYGPKPVFVLSSRPLDLSGSKAPSIEQLSGEPHEVVAALAARGIHNLYVDGGITIQRFIRAGLVDRITVTRVPVLIGEGIPLFGPLPHDIKLNHLSTRSFDDGLVASEYEVVE